MRMIACVLLKAFCCFFATGLRISVTESEAGVNYHLKPLWPEMGAVVEKFDLGVIPYDADFVTSLKKDISKYGIVVFKKTSMTATQQRQLSNKLGWLAEKVKQDTDPTLGVTRFSNNASYGYVESAKAWHTHGTWMPETHPYLMFRSIKSIKGGGTDFVSLKDLFQLQPEEVQERWRELHFVEQNGVAQPFVRKLNQTKDETMAFHLVYGSKGKGFVRNLGLPSEHVVPFDDMKKELVMAIDNSKLVHSLEWEDGDVALVDNRAVAHKGYDGTPKDAVRILDVTNIQAKSGDEDIEVRRRATPVPLSLQSKMTGIPETSLIQFSIGQKSCPSGQTCCEETDLAQQHGQPDCDADSCVQGSCPAPGGSDDSSRRRRGRKLQCPWQFPFCFLR